LVAYRANTPQTGNDVWLKPIDGSPLPFQNSQYEEWGAQFSPDSAWLAFVSNETDATSQVYVAPVGEPGLRRQVSINGGTAPRWRRGGRGLFFTASGGRAVLRGPNLGGGRRGRSGRCQGGRGGRGRWAFPAGCRSLPAPRAGAIVCAALSPTSCPMAGVFSSPFPPANPPRRGSPWCSTGPRRSRDERLG